MIKLDMRKTNLHSYNTSNENKVKRKNLQLADVNIKSVVDINILLNRVKVEEKNEIKRRIIFYSLTTLTLILFGFLITIIK
tara:strand:- start:1253 stop:1495 length:243 start_codon:yes stop_codon:yes gene_type:complete